MTLAPRNDARNQGYGLYCLFRGAKLSYWEDWLQ